ncbi:DUF4105 domain-containing protein [Maribacter algarum]|uniref:DUF4105 domain-containing protein n=1 Tax=Maribacter algarum (ex Zhang et al. 2020) TaxID=2578118 RepID=A0A5S3PM41_9FLAO|nr:DUF4105 domain-containing protein [Maribacter algarum]TMM53344.1 DUF4105 domain-containing protein [Maribacter algarum]
MNFKKIITLLLISFSALGFSQEMLLSPLSKISLLTVGTGDELYSKFGHSAFRIQDPTIGVDRIYDYGGFDFDPPGFYVKFARGKLNYRMSGYKTDSFVKAYKQENRWVKEQTLNLSQDERNEIFAFLQNNYREENRYYLYDFLFDNCATKIPEVLKKGLGDKLKFTYPHLKETFTFRELIHQSLDENAWATFGIDLALGSIIDRKATPWEHQFLPLYVEKQMPNTTINGDAFVTKEEMLVEEEPTEKGSLFVLTPLFWLIILMTFVVAVTYFDQKKKKRSKWLDFTLFLLTGLAGLLIFFLWFMTDHVFTKANFNLLWAFPLNLVLAFVFMKSKTPPVWVKKYLWVLLAGMVITGVLWIFKIQIFSPLLIFILVAVGIRYLFLINSIGNSALTQNS